MTEENGLPGQEVIETEVLVVGGGAAGALAAITAAQAGARVLLATKGSLPSGCSPMARSAFSAAMGDADPRDNPEIHCQDTLKAGAGLNDPELVRAMAYEIVEVVRALDEWGADLIKQEGKFFQRPSPGHTYARALHHYDTTGRAVMKPLTERVRSLAVDVLENVMLVDLLVADGRVVGAWGFDYRTGKLLAVGARSTVLATGGVGPLYLVTDNPPYLTGDGYAMAFRAGADMVDMEMIDFQLSLAHPEELKRYPPNSTGFISRGARLYNALGERFMLKRYPETKEINTRAAISRAIALEVYEGRGTPHGGVWLDASDISERIARDIPDVARTVARAGIDLSYQPLEVAVGAHTYLGGIRIDPRARTTLEGLYAAGETTGGIHGANRLGGAALSDALAFGAIAGRTAAAEAGDGPGVSVGALALEDRRKLGEVLGRSEGVDPARLKHTVQELMTEKAMVVREEKGLGQAIEGLRRIKAEDLPRLFAPGRSRHERLLRLKDAAEVANLVDVGLMLATAALLRRESRGGHFRLDHPQQDDANWRKNVVLRRSGDGVAAEPLSLALAGRGDEGPNH